MMEQLWGSETAEFWEMSCCVSDMNHKCVAGTKLKVDEGRPQDKTAPTPL